MVLSLGESCDQPGHFQLPVGAVICLLARSLSGARNWAPEVQLMNETRADGALPWWLTLRPMILVVLMPCALVLMPRC